MRRVKLSVSVLMISFLILTIIRPVMATPYWVKPGVYVNYAARTNRTS